MSKILEVASGGIYNVDTMSNEKNISSSIGRWGNSAAVRLPAVVLQQAGLALNDQIDIRVSRGKVTLQAKPKQDLSLDQLLDLITNENLHTEVDFGRPVGKELI